MDPELRTFPCQGHCTVIKDLFLLLLFAAFAVTENPIQLRI